MATFKKKHPFYPGGLIAPLLNKEIENILGPKTAEDNVKKPVVKE
ncbi:MAG: hypothetical protein ACK52J_02335 [bacterium]